MESVKEDKVLFPQKCEFCGNAGINKCGRCFTVYYCCREHQYQHWPLHKITCKKSSDVPLSDNENQPRSSNTIRLSNRKSSKVGKTKNHSPGDLNEPEKCSRSNPSVAKTKPMENLDLACNKFIRAMGSHGIYVLDNFMGSEVGNLILKEVESLYKKGIFEKGKLLVPHPTIPSETIRSDVVTWLVNPDKSQCSRIGNLIQKISYLIFTCNNMPNSGLLSRYRFIRRTNIMVACYPGNGTHYQRHIDNGSKDGRCITSVYYLNRDWKEEHGGILRAYPYFSSQYYDVEPIFDRLVMFWSNERVPHEVLPSFATRFAITVWYFDEDEAKEYVRKYELAAKTAQSS